MVGVEVRLEVTTPSDEAARWCSENLAPTVTIDDSLELVTYAIAVTQGTS